MNPADQDKAASGTSRERSDDAVYDELTQVNNELANLQREMAKANAELALLNEQKNRLLGMAAHDLRSPLGAILSFSEFLQADADASFSEQHREFIATIHSSSKFMLNLINDLLDVSSIESGQLKLNPGPGDLADLVVRTEKGHHHRLRRAARRSAADAFRQRQDRAGIEQSARQCDQVFTPRYHHRGQRAGRRQCGDRRRA
jgi:signal transduction histidine kinase